MEPTTYIMGKIRQAFDSLSIKFDGAIVVKPCIHETMGDYSCTVALSLENPLKVATALAASINAKKDPFFESVSVVAPGFVNVRMSQHFFTSFLHSFDSKKPKDRNGKKVIVEYSSPNIAKPFTIGHLRSTIIGDCIANVLSYQGFDVFRDNHTGDWGTQFGKLIVAINKWGDLEQIRASAHPVKDLVDLYVKYHTEAKEDPSLDDAAREWFTKLEKGDETARALWQQCVDWSWKEFSSLYEILGVKFTENGGRGYGESYFEDKMQVVIDAMRQKGYLKVGEQGAELFFFPNDEFPPLMIQKKDGSTLYATRDLATDWFRLGKYGDDCMVINEVGAEQELYFQQLYRIEELMGWYPKGHRVHIKHGHFRFADQKMSTRSGNVIWLLDVIEQARTRARLLSQKSADTDQKQIDVVAIGGLKWNDLKRAASLDVLFDWDAILSMEGNSGPYMQYSTARCASILQKATYTPSSVDEATTWDESERSILRQLAQFENVLALVTTTYAPHHLCTYLHSLARVMNAYYAQTQIVDGSAHMSAKLALTASVHDTLRVGLRLLGIGVPEQM